MVAELGRGPPLRRDLVLDITIDACAEGALQQAARRDMGVFADVDGETAACPVMAHGVATVAPQLEHRSLGHLMNKSQRHSHVPFVVAATSSF